MYNLHAIYSRSPVPYCFVPRFFWRSSCLCSPISLRVALHRSPQTLSLSARGIESIVGSVFVLSFAASPLSRQDRDKPGILMKRRDVEGGGEWGRCIGTGCDCQVGDTTWRAPFSRRSASLAQTTPETSCTRTGFEFPAPGAVPLNACKPSSSPSSAVPSPGCSGSVAFVGDPGNRKRLTGHNATPPSRRTGELPVDQPIPPGQSCSPTVPINFKPQPRHRAHTTYCLRNLSLVLPPLPTLSQRWPLFHYDCRVKGPLLKKKQSVL